MLISLVKKDFLLIKKYLWFLLLGPIGLPVFLHLRTGNVIGTFIIFLITSLYVEYILFNAVAMQEYKYKGAALLCTTPYTRNELVKAKYSFVLVVFICCYIIYTLTAVLTPLNLGMLDIFSAGMSLLIAALYFGVIIPVQYRFGYEKTKFVSFALIFVTPFIFPVIVKSSGFNKASLQALLPFPRIIQELLPAVLAVVIGLVSMIICMHIYSKKDV